MSIHLAVLGTSNAVLKQAKIELKKISETNKLDLRIDNFTCFDDCDFRKYDMVVVYEADFYRVLPKLPEVFQDITNQHENAFTVVIGKFTLPVDLKEFMTMVDKIPKRGVTLTVPVTNGNKVECVHNVLYFENINRRVYMKTVYDFCPVKLTMEDVRKLTAPFPFASPYVSYFVHLEWVERITTRDVLLKNGDVIPLSQKKAARFRSLYREYNEMIQSRFHSSPEKR
jgi:hypothetical protein